ncbi:MAG: hypothetical protein IT236_13580, partial [Bacteroidia bacterium]|nr:hypothetical protein [Bacteroidia bacterium]
IGFKARLGKEVFYTFDVNYTLRQPRYNHTYTNFRSEKQTDKFNLQQSALMINMGLEIF